MPDEKGVMTTPRLFISYSWSTPGHEQWVVDLATELVQSGVDVILDKWALREGHDSIAFMEQMVTDVSISKVVLVCDSVYAAKADGRSGGVGTETQIISAELYAKQAQDKFVAVVVERDGEGRPYLPTYYKSRIYVDLSESDRYAENFEKLLRWIFDKPLYVKPELGKPPSFILQANSTQIGTSALARRLVEGLKADKGFVRGALDEYLTTFSENLERFRISGRGNTFDDTIVESIESFLPARNELVHVLAALVQYGNAKGYTPRLHRFLEAILPYVFQPSHINQWNETDFDNFKFIVHELFLYVLALLLRQEQIEEATYILSQKYYLPGGTAYGTNTTVTFSAFREYMKSLELRNQRLQLRRLSLRADLLEQRSKVSGVQFRHLMQADFVCFLRADLVHADLYNPWWPETLLYASHHHGPFELFARGASSAYLDRVLLLLGVPDLKSLSMHLESYRTDRQSLPRWQFESFNPAELVGIEQLHTLAQ